MNGLTKKQVDENRKKYGSNILSKKEKESFLKMLIATLGDPIIKILLIALAVKTIFLFKDFNWYETVGIVIAIFLASAIALVGLSYMFSTPSEFYVFERYSILFAFEVTGIFCIFKNFGQLNINWKFLSNPDSIFRKSVFSIAKYSYGIYLITLRMMSRREF